MVTYLVFTCRTEASKNKKKKDSFLKEGISSFIHVPIVSLHKFKSFTIKEKKSSLLLWHHLQNVNSKCSEDEVSFVSWICLFFFFFKFFSLDLTCNPCCLVRNTLDITPQFRMERMREIKSCSLKKVEKKLFQSMFYNIETLEY